MAPTTPAAPTTAPSATASKKPRKNPARRKAERSKSFLDPSKENTALPTGNPAPGIQRSKQARTQSSPSILLAGQSAKRSSPPSASTATGPAPGKPPKPPAPQSLLASPASSLARRQTTPANVSGRSSIALVAPAMVTGGLIGCAAGAAILMAVSAWYDFAGVKAAVTTARAARLCVDNLTEEMITSLNAGTYNTDEALDILRRTTLAYASAVPEGAPLVDRVFREVDLVRHSRGTEVDGLLGKAYRELQVAGSRGGDAEEMRAIVMKHLGKLSRFASRATQDVVARNPTLRPCQAARPAAGRERVPSTTVNLTVRHK